MVMRHVGIDGSVVLRRMGILMKMNNEVAHLYGNESNKMGGLVLESTNGWANYPDLSLVLGNNKRLVIEDNIYPTTNRLSTGSDINRNVLIPGAVKIGNGNTWRGSTSSYGSIPSNPSVMFPNPIPPPSTTLWYIPLISGITKALVNVEFTFTSRAYHVGVNPNPAGFRERTSKILGVIRYDSSGGPTILTTPIFGQVLYDVQSSNNSIGVISTPGTIDQGIEAGGGGFLALRITFTNTSGSGASSKAWASQCDFKYTITYCDTSTAITATLGN
jgi:hypothetical protein